MKNILLILSSLGILNSFILIFYFAVTKKGNRTTNILFASLIFALTIRVWKSVLLAFSQNLHDFVLNFGLAGFLAIGPLFLLFVKSTIKKNYKLSIKDYLHILPSVIFASLWLVVIEIRNNNYLLWDFIYRSILLHYILYLYYSLKQINSCKEDKSLLIKQLNILLIFLLTIWFTYLLNAVSDFPYLSGALVYSGFVYFSLILFFNQGHIINVSSAKKYEKTGLKKEDNKYYLTVLLNLMNNEKLYKDNMISLSKLAGKMNTTTHIVSQVINDNFQKSFYELLSNYRIEEAKNMISDKSNKFHISEIAFEVGYNSLSAFNNAFKKETGKTPSQFKNEINNNE